MNRFFSKVWDRFNTIPAPVNDLPLSPVAPPELRQEQFADTHATARAEQERARFLYQRVVAANNAAVTRDYGAFVRDESAPVIRKVPKTALTDAELAELAVFEIRAR